MVMIKCNSCGVVNNSTTIFGVVCTGCKKNLDMFNTTFVLEEVIFGSPSNTNQKTSFVWPRVPAFPAFSASNPKAPVDLEKDAKAAKGNLDKVLSEVERLQEKVERGKNSKKKMSELLSSNDFLSPAAIEEKRKEVDGVKEAIEKSDTIHRRINKLSQEISNLKKSADYKQFFEKKSLLLKITMLETMIKKADKVQAEIAMLERDQHLLPDTELQKLEDKLTSIKKILGQDQQPEKVKEESLKSASDDQINKVLLVQERARANLECVICLDVPKANTPVISCLNHHLICSVCAQNPSAIGSCPYCRQDFHKTPPTKNLLAEKMIRDLC